MNVLTSTRNLTDMERIEIVEQKVNKMEEHVKMKLSPMLTKVDQLLSPHDLSVKQVQMNKNLRNVGGDNVYDDLMDSIRDANESAVSTNTAEYKNRSDEDPATSYFWEAVTRGKLAALKRLLEDDEGLVKLRNRKGDTPLHCAASAGHVDVVRLLLDAGANVSARGAESQRPLHRAVDSGRVEVVRVLLEAGASLHDRVDGDRGILFHAARVGQEEVLRCLLATVDKAERDRPDEFGNTLLYVGVPHEKVVQLLLEGGCNTEIETFKDTPLRKACREGHWKSAMLLIERGAVFDKQSYKGYNILQLATHYHGHKLVQEILNRGVDPNSTGDNSSTSLSIATRTGQMSLVKLLLERGASPEVNNNEPLRIATIMNNLTILEEMLKIAPPRKDMRNVIREARSAAAVWMILDVDPTCLQGDKGTEALREAVCNDCKDAFEAMLAAGAKFHAFGVEEHRIKVGNDTKTVRATYDIVWFCIMYDKVNFLEVILSKYPEKVNDSQCIKIENERISCSLLDIAYRLERYNCARILREHGARL